MPGISSMNPTREEDRIDEYAEMKRLLADPKEHLRRLESPAFKPKPDDLDPRFDIYG